MEPLFRKWLRVKEAPPSALAPKALSRNSKALVEHPSDLLEHFLGHFIGQPSTLLEHFRTLLGALTLVH